MLNKIGKEIIKAISSEVKISAPKGNGLIVGSVAGSPASLIIVSVVALGSYYGYNIIKNSSDLYRKEHGLS